MEDSLIDVALEDCRDKMRKAVLHTQAEFSGVRTGRATPALVEKLKVDYYGTEVPLQQLASFSVPEARLLVISPFDKSSIKAIEKAIQNSDIGINPANDGQVIRLAFPPLTEERRKELVKLVRHKAEEGRVAVRNVRRDVNDHLKRMLKDHEVSEDDDKRAETEIQKLTDKSIADIDKLVADKEKDLMAV